MITLHHLNNSRSQRILWLLEELNLPYEIKYYQRDSKTMLAPPELRAIHPLGKSPVITDGDITVAESGAIIEYIIDKYGNGRLRPKPNTPEALQYTFFLHYAEGSVMPPLLMSLIFTVITKPPVPFLIRPIAKLIANGVRQKFINPQLKTHFSFLENELAKRDWLAGDEFTAADIQMSFPVEAGASRLGFEKYPNLQIFLKRIHARPAYQKALERGGPFTL
jgi:glutathione S-transferase